MTRPSPPARSLDRRSPALARRLLAVACLAVCAGAGASAHAYSTPDAYAEQPVLGGGGGRWFSGSPADGFGCSVCHASAPGQRRFPLRVAGLPADGYAPAQKQEILLGWPEMSARWTELRPDPTVARAPGEPSPAIGLVAELVAESGKGSGTIEIDSTGARPEELCEMTRANLKPRLAARLYQVRPGKAPLMIRPDSTGMMRCESRQLGQRCLVALTSCGSKLVRFSWTAPSTWEGPIWFSAGFVATEALSGTPAQDSVDEVSVPIVQADSKQEKYRQVLRSGCGLAARSSQSAASRLPGWWLVPGLLGLLCARRARTRRVRGRA